ncbi:hypothetical protein [Vibrio crassostreae]|uniref:hypothetical protein n=1 Tax=Vibrio crassostreae TaxID=246167 RepID=UPI001B301958|nr:hypothetical protein [Vibrio crassostreae]
MSNKIHVKCFSKKLPVANLSDLIRVLNEFVDDSVSIVATKPSGVSKVAYVDVTREKSAIKITDSYTNQLIPIHSFF